jgi:hypothetical protein
VTTPRDSDELKMELLGFDTQIRREVQTFGGAVELFGNAGPENRTVFVGHPFSFPKDDYRRVYAEVGEEYSVDFVFADDELTNKHMLVKIESMMNRAAFSLFDITEWNPNVALELGLAYGRRLDYYILFDPTKGDTDVLADVRGIDRINYESYTQLGERLSRLMRDQFGAPAKEQKEEAQAVVDQLDGLRKRIPDILRTEPGQPVGGIASSLGVPIDLAQTLVRPMIGTDLETRGVRRGTRYYLSGDAPPEEIEDELEAEEIGHPSVLESNKKDEPG